jgi:hypothetical protein
MLGASPVPFDIIQAPDVMIWYNDYGRTERRIFLDGREHPKRTDTEHAYSDQSALLILKGILRSFSYVNPHSWISIEGSPAGTSEVTRDIEATSPSTLAGIGLTAEAMHAGDLVTVGIRPLRDGRQGGSMVFVIRPDGKSYGANSEALGLRVEYLKP